MRTFVLAVFYSLLLILITPYLLLCMLTGTKDPLIRLGRWAVRAGCRFLGIRVQTSGLERLDPATPYVFMSNHLSFLDGPLLATAIPRPVRIILKKSVFRIPVLGIGMRHIGYVPVDRKGAKGGQKSIHRAAELMHEKGYSFLVFPEGTRSRDGRIQAFRRGGFFLALEGGAPIVPVTIKGTFDLMPKGQWHARKGVVQIDFHNPMPVTGFTAETMGELMEGVRRAIVSSRA
ncbi:MAG: lysophospholipid acyltransferase family protein [Candidatus Aminicenantales bacterium]|jgi:1-acyl-sn-glycerol-3-phosphate acyltransferase